MAASPHEVRTGATTRRGTALPGRAWPGRLSPDIDIVVNRTLVHGPLALVLAAAYLAGVEVVIETVQPSHLSLWLRGTQ